MTFWGPNIRREGGHDLLVHSGLLDLLSGRWKWKIYLTKVECGRGQIIGWRKGS